MVAGYIRSSGQYDLGQLPIVNASSVEMVVGDASSLYGGGSIGGIINIRSDIGYFYPRQSFRLRTGTYTSETSYSKSFKSGSYFGTLGLSSLYDNGYQPNAYFRRNSADLYFNLEMNKS